MNNLKNEICSHIEQSIKHKTYIEEIIFDMPLESIRRIKGILHFDTSGYKCVIRANEIRHVNKRHPNDVRYICEIPNIMQDFYSVKKSITRDTKTGSSLVSLEFYKKYGTNTVKLVKLKIHKNKRLELKTLFVEEQ